MSDDEQHDRLNRAKRSITGMAERAYSKLVRGLDSGARAKSAVSQAIRSFNAEYYEGLASYFSEVLGHDIPGRSIQRWATGDLPLSKRLYRNQKQVTSQTLHAIQLHNHGIHSARKLAMELYDGYGNGIDVLDVKKKLPKYIRKAPKLANEYERLVVQNQVSKLRTPALKAAYMQALERIEKGAGIEERNRLLRTAFAERNRYYANRIAQHELQRAYAEQRNGDMIEDTALEYVELRMSGSHPVTDICDLHTSVDLYGLGPGVYPKDLAPQRPFHPYCRCGSVPRYDLTGKKARHRPAAEREYLRKHPDAARIVGSRHSLNEVLQGKSVASIINARAPAGYGLRTAGEVYKEALPRRMVNGVIRNASAPSADAGSQLRSMFASDDVYTRHLGKRLKEGAVKSSTEYAAATFAVLAGARRLLLAEHAGESAFAASGKVGESDWVVLLTTDGRIITSYQYNPKKTNFEERHETKGGQLNEYAVSGGDTEALSRVFGSR